jgi:IS30 family transposase
MNRDDFSIEKRKGKHICLWEREEIEKALRRGAGVRSIARTLGRSASTVSREIKRGSVPQRIEKKYQFSKKDDVGYIEKEMYFADTGQTVAMNNTSRRGGKYKLFEDMELVRYIENQILNEKWSPAMITGWLQGQGHNFKTMVCFKTIYNYIDRGQLAVKNINLLLKVRLKPKKKRIRQRKRILGKSIEQRPAEVNDRQEFGHWEGDTILGKEQKSIALTLVERKTRKGFILPLKDKSALSVIAAFKTLKELSYYEKLFKTITFDNGSEFADCHKLETENLQVYFAHPYSAYERGANENYNGIIRRYIPKGKDLSQYSQSDLNRINNQIDSLPRKHHNYKTAQMMFDLELEKIFGYPAG